ncbi:MAG: phosphate signaling complex PhoU family protein [Phycisphaerales bacterium]
MGGSEPNLSCDPRALIDGVESLRRRLARQGSEVQWMVEHAVEAVFDGDAQKAGVVIERDAAIDREDVRIERAAVELLQQIAAIACTIPERELRMILTIVKVNNEFERIADLAVYIAERIESFADERAAPPAKFRVLANSVIGIMSSTNGAFAHMDSDAARLVLASDDATEGFKQAIMRDVEEQLSRGTQTVDFAFALNRVAASLGRMADHCTNIAEQVLYVQSGKIVRHRADQWSSPEDPDDSRTPGTGSSGEG